MACDVGQYLPDHDQPVEEIERLVHLPKKAYPRRINRRQARRNSYTPRGRIELAVLTEEGQELTLIGYESRKGDFIVELHRGELKLRAFHTHQGHRNPGHEHRMPDGHMHFPSRQHPLIGKAGQYAYEWDSPDVEETTDMVQYAAPLMNIEIDALQLQLAYGGRR